MISHGQADFYLEIEGTDYPFFLASEGRVKQWGDGFAPMLAPQVRTTGFGYEHVPPEIEVIESFEDFSGGAGYTRAPSGARNTYAYTRGVDLSWEREGCLSLKQRAVLESDASAIAAAPTKFYYSSLGLFMLAGAYIYEWDLATTAWVERDNATGTFAGAAYTDIIELDGVLYAARGGAADYKSSSDGITWTAFTAEDENADVFTVRGNGSDVAGLWKVNDNIIKVNAAPTAAGWTGADEVGNTGEVTRSALTVDNDIYVFKDRGFYLYTGTETQDLWLTEYVTSLNGKNAFLWANRKIYVPYGEELLEYDPYGDTGLLPIYPSPGMDHQEVLGQVTAVGGDNKRLYIAVKNKAGNTYLMKGRYVPALGRWAWHTIAYLGANDCNALRLVAPGILHASNPGLVFGYGTAGNYMVLPRNGVHPSEDSNCTFDLTSAEAWGSFVDFGASTFPKFTSRGMVLTRDVYPSRKVKLHYEVDYTNDHYTLLTTVADGLTEENEREDVEFHAARYRLHLESDSAALTPVVDAMALVATLNPRRKRIWRPTVVLSDSLPAREGSDPNFMPSAEATRDALFLAVRKRLTLTERNGKKYAVRLLGLQGVGLSEENVGDTDTDLLGYQLEMVEIADLEA